MTWNHPTETTICKWLFRVPGTNYELYVEVFGRWFGSRMIHQTQKIPRGCHSVGSVFSTSPITQAWKRSLRLRKKMKFFCLQHYFKGLMLNRWTKHIVNYVMEVWKTHYWITHYFTIYNRIFIASFQLHFWAKNSWTSGFPIHECDQCVAAGGEGVEIVFSGDGRML